MRLPRAISANELIKGLERVGYAVTRQKGSHVRLTTQRNGEHHVTVPGHEALKLGTLAGILADVGEHLRLDRETLLDEMFK
jgi:predicted RNA binding protein YcfA (HicA-like mRNA interferase family)